MDGHIVVVGLGGTISMAATAGAGAHPRLGAAEVTAGYSTPPIRIVTQDIARKPSSSLDLQDLSSLAHCVDRAITEGARAVVVTTGTDTLEEVAFFLSLTVKPTTPVALTGAMKLPGEPGHDGPANLHAAVRVALEPESRGLGPLVVFDSEIHAARWVRKVHTTRAAAFSSWPLGPLGWVSEDRVRIALRPSGQPPHIAAPVGRPQVLPVAIIEASYDLEPAVVTAAADVSAALVVSATGGGHVSAAAAEALGDAATRRPVVLCSRTGGGQVFSSTYGYAGGEIDLLQRGLISGGALDARKCRVAVQLLIAAGASRGDIAAQLRLIDSPEASRQT